MTNKKLLQTLLLMVIAGTALPAQSTDTKPAKEPSFYRFDFELSELEAGKTVNSRSYSTIVLGWNHQPYQIRTGTRVPVPNGKDQFTYMDVGVSIDIRDVHESAGYIQAEISTDLSSLAPPSDIGQSGSNPPLVRNNRWTSSVIAPIGKRTVLFSSDDPTSKRKTQVELTITHLPARP